ncbi:hypothetical protein ASF48_05115 [Rathayibacter sp. Leaf299]|uniref:RusA family crossover junction endodeoxyribonuclease n=1 Tax=Rathayibacter sp. Leaf299 TaxID=1736328 RepID=UPI0006FE3F04|nr:RusA family crossover junction endodeoxyribonuclease [Rathayibacter sp. Leaf299]KQQ22566.1 hypothetical protein ASF48_05115 [Rathayibacter sp. Leaf299]
MTAPLVIRVDGKPIPQGSKRVYKNRAVDDNAKTLKPWRRTVKAAGVAAMDGAPPLDGPLQVSIKFRFERPKTVRRAHPTVIPDLDKLVRSVFDALTDAEVWADDSRVVDVHATKAYAPTPGALIRVGIYEGDPS